MFFGSCCVEWVSSGAKAVLLLSEWWVEPRRFYHWVNGEWSQGCFTVEWMASEAKAVLLLSEWCVEPWFLYCHWVNVKWSKGSWTVTEWMSSGAKALVLSLSEWSKGCCIVEWMTSGERLSFSEWSGSRNSSVVECQTCDWKVLRASPGRRIFFSRGSFLCRLLFQYLLHPHPITTGAHKRSQSFYQKCQWQVTA